MHVKRLLPAIPFAVAVVYLYFTEQIRETGLGTQIGAKVFPRLLSIALAIGALLWFREANKEAKHPELSSPLVVAEERSGGVWIIIAAIAWTFFYYLVFQRVGYLLATLVYLFVLMIYFNRGRWLQNVLTSVFYSLGSYYLFSHILGVALPKGLFLDF